MASHTSSAFSGVELLLLNARPSISADGTPWVSGHTSPSLTVYHCSVPGSSRLRFKAVGVVPRAPSAVCRFVGDTAKRLTWDSNIAALEVHPLPASETSAGQAFLLHSSTRAVGPISARDFVDAVAVVGPLAPDGRYANGGVSVEDDAHFPQRAGFVRGWNSAGGGWLFEPLRAADGRSVHTRIHYVIQTDLRGWLPTLIVNNALTGSYITFFKDLTEALTAGVPEGEGQEEAQKALGDGSDAS